MSLPSGRFTIGRSMIVIAVVAALLSLPTTAVQIGLLFMTVPALILIPAGLAPPGRRIEAAYWALSLHPLVFLAWLSAWRSFAIRQQLYPSDKYLLTLDLPYFLASLSRFYLPIFAVFGWGLASCFFPQRQVSKPLLVVPIVWLTTMVVLMWDPFELSVWAWD
jgi:hypothetical protein